MAKTRISKRDDVQILAVELSLDQPIIGIRTTQMCGEQNTELDSWHLEGAFQCNRAASCLDLIITIEELASVPWTRNGEHVDPRDYLCPHCEQFADHGTISAYGHRWHESCLQNFDAEYEEWHKLVLQEQDVPF